MNWGLIAIYGVSLVGLLLIAHDHGKPRSDESFWRSLIATTIHLVLIWWALGWRFI